MGDVLKMTKAERVLREIKARDGMTFTQIQKFVCEMNGLNWGEMQIEDSYNNSGRMRRRHRGYWCDYLLGNVEVERWGLLSFFCQKGEDGKWRVVKPIKAPWSRAMSD